MSQKLCDLGSLKIESDRGAGRPLVLYPAVPTSALMLLCDTTAVADVTMEEAAPRLEAKSHLTGAGLAVLSAREGILHHRTTGKVQEHVTLR